jgi:hypothetical protein
MKITYNETEKCVEIKDGLKNHFLLMKALMILNLANSILNLSDVRMDNFRFINVVWAILGIISILVLYNFIVKKTAAEKLPVDQIKGLNERTFMGRKKYFIDLKNGKKRDLLEVKSESEFKQLRKMFQKNGIQL